MGIFGVQMMTPLFILFWVLGLFLVLNNIGKIVKFSYSKWITLLVSAVAVYYSLYLAPHIYQILYWRSGLLPYTAAIVIGIWVFYLITRQSVLDKPSRLSMFLIGALALLAGGFSEAGSTYLAAVFGIYLILSGIGLYKRQEWARKTFASAGIALIFIIVAMVLLISSPTSQVRMDRYGDPTPLTQLPILVISLSLGFIKLSFMDLPLPHLVIILTFLLLGYLLFPRLRNDINIRKYLYIIIVVAAIGFLLIGASLSPSAYIEQAPPAPRARIIARFTMICTIATLAWIFGSALKSRFNYKLLNYAAILMVLLAYGYAVRSILITSDKLVVYKERAELWDERDDKIRQAAAHNTPVVDVRAIDSLPVGGIRDFKPSEKHWINGCAARYYGVDAIRAILP